MIRTNSNFIKLAVISFLFVSCNKKNLELNTKSVIEVAIVKETGESYKLTDKSEISEIMELLEYSIDTYFKGGPNHKMTIKYDNDTFLSVGFHENFANIGGRRCITLFSLENKIEELVEK